MKCRRMYFVSVTAPHFVTSTSFIFFRRIRYRTEKFAMQLSLEIPLFHRMHYLVAPPPLGITLAPPPLRIESLNLYEEQGCISYYNACTLRYDVMQ